MSLLEMVCKELGVEIGEAWEANDGKRYMIERNIIVEHYEPEEYSETDYEGWVVCDPDIYKNIILGNIKPIWKPAIGEVYYTPSPINYMHIDGMYEWTQWEGCELDCFRLEHNLVYKTKEDAIEVANKMLNVLKENN